MINSPLYYLEKAEKGGWALPHFNFSNAEILRAIVEAAFELKSPLFVGVSEGERKFLGPKQARSLVTAFREEFNLPLFLNADHTKSLEKAKEAIEMGYDALLIDGSELSLAENIELTKEVVDWAKSKNPHIIVEGELGYLRGESKIQKVIEVKEEDFTKPEEAEKFVKQTNIDLLAPAVGNIHGIITESVERLHFDLITAIKKQIGKVYLVLHGGSGLAADDIRGAIKAGMSVVHINTDLRIAFTNALKQALSKQITEVVPYHYLASIIREVKKVAKEKIRLFGSVNKI